MLLLTEIGRGMYAFSHLHTAFCATRETRAFFARVCFEGLTSAFCPKIQSINVIYTIHLLSWKKDFVYSICPGCRIRSDDMVHVNIIPLTKSCITCKHNEKFNVKTLYNGPILLEHSNIASSGKKILPSTIIDFVRKRIAAK